MLFFKELLKSDDDDDDDDDNDDDDDDDDDDYDDFQIAKTYYRASSFNVKIRIFKINIIEIYI